MSMSVTDLLPEEKAALIAALENDGNLFTSRTDKEPGPSLLWEYGGKGSWDLTPAGQIVATLLKRESRLERAKEKLVEWEKLADDARQPHPMNACATLVYEPGHGWYATVEWAERNERHGDCSTRTCGPSGDDPLTAVVEASKRTPWPVEE